MDLKTWNCNIECQYSKNKSEKNVKMPVRDNTHGTDGGGNHGRPHPSCHPGYLQGIGELGHGRDNEKIETTFWNWKEAD